MKTYIVEAHALNEIWYKETWKVQANTRQEAERLVETQSLEAELEVDEQLEVESTRAEFEIQSVKREERMTKEELREAIEDRSKSIMEMFFQDSLSECFEDMLLDLKHMAKAKTFKQVCELQGRDYKEEIQILKKEQA